MIPKTPYGDSERYNEYAQKQGMRQIADMIYRDFNYEQYGVDHWSGQPQCRIELVVFGRDQWREFIKEIESILPSLPLHLVEQLKNAFNNLENENKQAEDQDNNRV